MNSNSNGRVNILGENNMNRFQLYDKIPVDGKDNYYKTAMVGNWQNTILSDLFFSKENIKIIQNGIRAGVYKKSNKRFIIGEQNEDILKIIMRSTFLQHSKNRDTQITEQISELNNIVFDYAVPQIIGEATGYIKYKNDASVMYTPMERPSNTQHFKTLEHKSWF